MFVNFLNYFLNSSSSEFLLNSLLLRSLGAFIFSFLFSIIGLKYLIKYLKSRNAFQPIRLEGPRGHSITKEKTPTMGGLISCLAILFSGLLFTNTKDIYIISTLFVSMSFGIIGLIDDVMKIFYKNTQGFKGSIKILLQITICGTAILWLIYNNSTIASDQSVFLPFFKTFLYIGILFVPFIVLVIVGSANSVNLTDGLDGLAIVPVMFCSFALGVLAILSNYGSDITFIKTLNFDNPSELAILCSAVIGAGVGFFIFNKRPAKIFMGDVGALMYGSFLGCVAVMLKFEIFYGIAGLLFVIESISVILQVLFYRLFNKQVFKMAPIHHHFEKMGWSETKVVKSFWAFSLICLIIAIIGIINF